MINWIILGLGNPGEKFENTRHNISWWALDIISNLYLYPSDNSDHTVKETILPDLIMEKRDENYY